MQAGALSAQGMRNLDICARAMATNERRRPGGMGGVGLRGHVQRRRRASGRTRGSGLVGAPGLLCVRAPVRA